MQQRHHDRFQYFRELANTSRNFYVSYVSQFINITDDTRVLEIGCGEGGNLLPFACLHCAVTGIDIHRGRIEQAISFFQQFGEKGTFVCHDFMTYPQPTTDAERFDLILVHDVVEHIPPSDKYHFFMHIHGFLRSGGIVFFGFPAWHNPFGGHQQLSVGLASKLPFIHLLPNPLYRCLLRVSGAAPDRIEELLGIKQARMTVERFEQLADSAEYTVADRTLWLINPHYEQKFSLKARKLWLLLAKLPYLRNYFTTSAFYVLRE